MANIGKSITIRGDVSGDEDLVIEGHVEGRIELKNHHLTVGANGEVQAEIAAKAVTIIGRVSGNVAATERVEVQDTGRLDGDLASPRLLIHEGAVVNGSIAMKGLPSAIGTAAQPPRPGAEPAKPAVPKPPTPPPDLR